MESRRDSAVKSTFKGHFLSIYFKPAIQQRRAGHCIPRFKRVRVALFDLPQSLDHVPSEEGEQRKGVGILSYPQHSQFFNTFLHMPWRGPL